MSTDKLVFHKREFMRMIPAALAVGIAPATLRAAQQSPQRSTRTLLLDAMLTNGEETLADTSSGKIRGFKRGPVRVFKGIPYGAPTDGVNRFKPPQPVSPWTGVRSCLSYGPICPILGTFVARDEDKFLLCRGYEATPALEDCLRLNVWTPAAGTDAKKPVMVYMHGGGFAGGSSQDIKSYDGTALALTEDVVVVTHNHRLNVFGYLNLSNIGDSRYADSANVGLLDIAAVMQWVKTNIASFGGDPNRVMIFGQSGGGAKVGCLMAMPSMEGLFHSAAVQSGSILRVQAPEDSLKLAQLVLDELAVSGKNTSVLESASTEDIIRAAGAAEKKLARPPNMLAISFKRPLPGWGPTRGSSLLPEDPFDPVAPSVSKNVPMIIGTNQHEFVNGVDNPEAATMTKEVLRERVRGIFADSTDKIIEAYSRYYPDASAFDLFAVIAASGMRGAAVQQGVAKSRLGGAPVYEYMYTWRTKVLDGRPGTFHSAEIAMVFNNALLCDQYTGGTDEALALAGKMSGAWAALARTGKPQHAGLQHWPQYDASSRQTMIFDTEAKVVSAPEAEGLKLIDAARSGT